ncbi:unnamed protein product [Arctia plantaginis]|uniref:Uncharacterized protein n=1 Tax=Arctia plantaginis TaxID=874455 RepID=A0A8S1BCM6_ARCPL|nr:unnamed protein product [Arctia plantaginis]CAB3257335.1 unnamed protein product [Arctia plantaginis]
MSLDAITRMMNSFKHFEKKLDKLQDDVNYQGQTLLDLRVMMMNLSAGHIGSPDAKSDEMKRPRNKAEGIEHEDKILHTATIENNRQVGPKSLPVSKIPSQKRRRLSALDKPAEALAQKIEPSQVHIQRHRKADAIRKGNAVRVHKKKSEKKKPVKV